MMQLQPRHQCTTTTTTTRIKRRIRTRCRLYSVKSSEDACVSFASSVRNVSFLILIVSVVVMRKQLPSSCTILPSLNVFSRTITTTFAFTSTSTNGRPLLLMKNYHHQEQHHRRNQRNQQTSNRKRPKYDGFCAICSSSSSNRLFATNEQQQGDTSLSMSSSSPSIPSPSSASLSLSSPSKMITKNGNNNKITRQFDLSVALLCSGLAFDAYVEPDNDSSRWERGSSGVNVAFCSIPYTRSLYRGLIELQVHKVTNLPTINENDSTAERLISGDGIDAYVLATIVEGRWKEDIETLEKNEYMSPNGISDMITGAAHVSRTSTCWSTITREKSELALQKRGKMLPYHIPKPPSSLLDVFTKRNPDEVDYGVQAVWPKECYEPSIYLYVQDPSKARIVLTVMDDDRIVLNNVGGSNDETNGNNSNMNQNGRPIGLTYKQLSDIIPQVGWTTTKFIEEMKRWVLKDIQQQLSKDPTSNANKNIIEELIQQKIEEQLLNNTMNFVWTGALPLLRKPRKLDKGNQRWVGAAAGAAIAGPVGAAAGAVLANLYESPISGQIHCTIKYTPLPPPLAATPSSDNVSSSEIVTKANQRNTYIVKGGTPGVDWGTLYSKYHNKVQQQHQESGDEHQIRDFSGKTSDLEHCFFVTHKKTGATCAVYRSLQYKYIVVSFRGTCAPIDLITDASLIQETWIEGEDENIQVLPKVHVGFRSSMNSISRRLKELLLAIPAPGETIEQYDMYVTGHSLGGALSTLFTADIGQYGIDAGRGLPQLEQSEPWWKSIASTLMGNKNDQNNEKYTQGPPRPKSLRMYNFGSPRVGNVAFAELFDALVSEGYITDAYRIVNGDDVVARLPRSVNALVFGNINYEHVGTTVLLSDDSNINNSKNDTNVSDDPEQVKNRKDTYLWIEGESDDSKCPVRDGEMLTSPMAEGTLLNDLIAATREGFATASNNSNKSDNNDESSGATVGIFDRLSVMAGKVTDRVKNLKASDIASIIGIDQSFTDRELRIIQSLLQGNALAHHLEDQYYAGMGRASGFLTRLNEEIVELPISSLSPPTLPSPSPEQV